MLIKTCLAIGAIALAIAILWKVDHTYANRPATFATQATCAELGYQFAEDWYVANPNSYRNPPEVHFNQHDQRCYVKMHYEPKGDEAHQAMIVYDATRGAGSTYVERYEWANPEDGSAMRILKLMGDTN